MTEKYRILIVDDDVDLLLSCAKALRSNGTYDVETLSDSNHALTTIQSEEYDLIISDLAMPGVDGMDLLREARTKAPETPFVIFSAYGNAESVVSAMRDGAFDFVEKPFRAERLRVVVEKSLQHRGLHKEKKFLKDQLQHHFGFDDIIGRSATMRPVFELISRVADGETNVTVTGESGTGKELVARAIHNHSLRKAKPFVPVNCGAFPEHLFESELFGYEKGAFTGAYRRKPGLLEFANRGTFFLDEICELTLPLQVKLLRMLQDRRIRRVGGTDEIDIDVRIISASNRNLEEAVTEQSLREDLYYRLNVISIHLPPLRERKEDLPLLCRHFITKYAKLTPKTINGFTENALRCLEKYNWPGNIRELENVVERAITLTTEPWIGVQALPENVTCMPQNGHVIGLDLPLKEAKDRVVSRFEKEYIVRMLSRHNGNVTQAAEDSGIDRRTFHRLISRHHLHSRNWKQTSDM